MLDIFKIFSNDKNSSKNVAKERLKLVLIHDKGNYSPEEHIEVKMIKTKSQDNSEMVPALVANIPIKRMK